MPICRVQRGPNSISSDVVGFLGIRVGEMAFHDSIARSLFRQRVGRAMELGEMLPSRCIMVGKAEPLSQHPRVVASVWEAGIF